FSEPQTFSRLRDNIFEELCPHTIAKRWYIKGVKSITTSAMYEEVNGLKYNSARFFVKL
ncbi:10138_t:CDS:1, partial [Funneliformis mosseae]